MNKATAVILLSMMKNKKNILKGYVIRYSLLFFIIFVKRLDFLRKMIYN